MSRISIKKELILSLNLVDYCLKNGDWISGESIYNQNILLHKYLDVQIIDEYLFNYNIILNQTWHNNLGIKIIEKKLKLKDQIKLLDIFIKLYSREVNNGGEMGNGLL